MALTAREFHLRRRPVGMPTNDDFELQTLDLPALGPGQVRVTNLYLSVDPYMRGRMTEAKSYVPPFELGAALEGGAVGRVEESTLPAFAVGDVVLSMMGWRDRFVTDGKGLSKIDPALAPLSAFLGTLGMPGFTAYVGLLDVGELKEGETVLVSGAAGAVGSVACQIAKAKGCTVIGVTGSDEKARWLLDNGCVDHAINYRTAPKLKAAIQTAGPEGVDLTFENVGGDQLEAALACSKTFARIVLCGLIANYNATSPAPGPSNFRDVLTKRLRIQGMIVTDHAKRRPDFLRDMSDWIKTGKMKWTETIVEGLERTPEAFAGLFEGRNLGKMVVKI
ncbi:MAG: NADP-dependent oxidoreductase [Gemmatimonadota bacterium]